MAKRILKKVFKGGNEYEVGNIKNYSITESDVSVATDSTMGISPYNTSYGYTGITINESTGIKWKEGAIYCFVVNTTMVVSSTYRNVRVRIGSSGSRIPVFGDSSILNGSSYFKKAQQRLFVYKTTYQSTGALHMITDTDTNTTYSQITKSAIQDGTETNSRTISASVIKSALPTISNDSNNILGYVKIRAGNKSDYDNMASHDTNTLYFCIDDTSGGGNWEPSSDTIAYYPLDTDFNDYSSSSLNLTNSGGSITTAGGVSCAYYNGSSYSKNTTASFTNTRTISCWRRPASTSGVKGIVVTGDHYDLPNLWGIQQSSGVLWGSEWATTEQSVNSGITVTTNNWYYVVITIDSGTTAKIYVNGELKNTVTRSNAIQSGTTLAIGAKSGDTQSEKANGYISKVILESKVWTAEEVSNYYNQTKADYGL